jgi:hypothetical protein
MFSGLVSSVRSSMKSPKALLASYLVSSLETFFIVDPDAIELNLLSNNKIVLHHVQLKPQRSCGQILQGEVDKIDFSWIWGGDGATSFIRETKLTIHGACFRLKLVSLGYSPNEFSEATTLSQRISFESFCAYLIELSGKKVMLGPHRFML